MRVLLRPLCTLSQRPSHGHGGRVVGGWLVTHPPPAVSFWAANRDDRNEKPSRLARNFNARWMTAKRVPRIKLLRTGFVIPGMGMRWNAMGRGLWRHWLCRVFKIVHF